ncbi:MAG: lysophospholipid acyltransferase family protein, partial [Lentisphaeria bacterium]
IVIFPQSTRDVVFHPEEFSSAAVKMARKFNIPIVPIALKTDFAPSGKSGILKDFGKLYPERGIHFAFGEPLKVAGNGKEEHEKIVNFIVENLKKWQQ